MGWTEGLHIRVDHDRNQLFERDLGFPAELPPGLGGICLKTDPSVGRK